MRIHDVARAGFERGAEEYERGRPGYPRAAVDDVLAELELGPGRTVVDLAAGTGKFTRGLTATGATVIAAEPVAAMRALLARTTPDALAMAAVAEALPFTSASVDALTVAQGFHWFDAAAALDELARVLRPGAGVALIWNERDLAVRWQAQLKELMDRVAGPMTSRYRSGEGAWESAFDADPRFTPIDHRTYENLVEMDRETFSARISSTSYVSALKDSARAAVVAEALDLLPRSDRVVETYATDLFLCRRI